MTVDAPPGPLARTSTRGLLYFMIALIGFSLADAAAKYLSRDYSVIQVAWARYTFHLLFALAFMSRARLAEIRATKQLPLQIGRALLLLVATATYYVGLSHLPLAETTAITYSYPIILTGLSALILREKVGRHRWGAVIVGFLGIVIITHPGGDVFHWAAAVVGATALCFALYQIATRMLSGRDSVFTTLFYTGLVGAVVTSFAAPFSWTAPSPEAWGLMVGLGVFGFGTHFLLIKALDCVPASRLAPYGYIDLIWATSLGYLVFGDFPDQWTIVGAGVIVASGLYIFFRERWGEVPRAVSLGPPK